MYATSIRPTKPHKRPWLVAATTCLIHQSIPAGLDAHHLHMHHYADTCANAVMCLQSADYSYNYVTWTGGDTAYQTCNLAARGATYVGTCQAAVTCNTTLTKDAVDTSLNDVSYSCSDNSTESACAATCDQQDWCAALCYCGDSNCTSSQV